MIEKNVVLIETLDNIGTGLLYPCDYKGKDIENDRNVGASYILITNHHVLGYPSKINIENYVKLTFYDDWGNLIAPNDIWRIKLFEIKDKLGKDSEDDFLEWDRTKDIVAILIVLKRGIRLTLSRDIMFNKLENRDKLYVEGYPGVLLEQEVSQRIQLEGMEKAIFPFNDRVGAYQITDDYHWYNNLADRDLLQGLSGSPVFVKKNEKEFLLGINQSIANVDDGKNPFKIVYYLRIEHIMDYLRENNCIIYRKVSENQIQIEWIYEQNLEKENDITILMIGGSGAGKSSLARNFALHGNVINSTNDGQTTRTDVIYQYSLTEKEPKATVFLLNQSKFVERMLAHVNMYAFAFLFEKVFGLSKEFVTDEKKLMKNFFQILSIIGDIEESKEGKEFESVKTEILCCLEDELVNEQKIKLYEALLNIFIKSKYKSILKYILDENEVSKVRKDIMFGDEKQKKKIPAIVVEVIEQFDKNNFEFEEYRIKIINEMSEKKENSKYEDYNHEDNKSEYYKLISHCEGFFELKDFEYLLEVDDIQNIKQLDDKWGYLVETEDSEVKVEPEYIIIPDVKWKIYSDLKEYYKKLYGILKAAIKTKYPFASQPIRLDIITKQNREFLSECLKVSGNRSLTGMVDKVKIQDKISNEYAFILREFNINKLTLVDTCGLDHIETDSKKDIIRRLDDYHYEMNSDNSIWYGKKGNIEADRKVAILFVKKLDAGKPDELRTILPCIKKSIPKAPIYCMFTGIDIFYKYEQEISALDWSFPSNRCPKVVTYILDENSELKKYMSNTQYLVLKNNIIPYCGKQSLLKKQFYFAKSNYQYIRKMIASISMKEASSLEIIEVNDDLKEKLTNSVFSIVEYIFANASLEASDYRWNTINADAMSGYNGKLGFCYTYPHCFYQLFHKAYVESMDSNAANILQGDGVPAIDAIMSALYEMETKFLGSNENLYTLDIGEDKKNDFRKILEKMYIGKDDKNALVFKYNIFDKQTYENILSEDKKSIKKECRNEFFNCIFGFEKGLKLQIENDGKACNVQQCLTEVFVKLLMEQLEDDNKKKSDNIVRISEHYYEELQNIEKSFMQKYGMDDKEKFLDLMIRFFDNKKSIKNNDK